METIARSSRLPALILAGGLIAATIIFSHAYTSAREEQRSIDVSGSSERVVASDTAKWSVSVSRQANTGNLKDMATQLGVDIKAVSDYLQQQGIKKEEITLQPPAVMPVCENQGPNSYMSYDRAGNAYCNGQVAGYNLQQQMVVETTLVDKLTSLSQSAFSSMAERGIILTSTGVEYYLRNLNQIKMELLSEATQNAQQRAEKILQATGASIGKLQSASVGVFQVTAVNSTEISDYGAYDTTAQQKKITSIVRASFSLK